MGRDGKTWLSWQEGTLLQRNGELKGGPRDVFLLWGLFPGGKRPDREGKKNSVAGSKLAKPPTVPFPGAARPEGAAESFSSRSLEKEKNRLRKEFSFLLRDPEASRGKASYTNYRHKYQKGCSALSARVKPSKWRRSLLSKKKG